MAEAKGPAASDVRMRGFLTRIQPEEALARLRPLLRPTASERVGFAEALGRTLAAPVTSAVDVPAFARSAVDGYGVKAEETFGAGPGNALAFRVVGEVLPGRPPGDVVRGIGPGEAVRIMTGGALPPGVDAVAMAEHADERQGVVHLGQALPPGRNVVRVGEDVRRGEELLLPGRVLRPHDLGLLASIGQLEAEVRRRPRVAIATTGAELVPPAPAGSLAAGTVVNSNTFVLEALVAELGGEALPLGIVGDDLPAVRALVQGFPGDLLVTTGGTSVGVEDRLPVVVAELGRLEVHGLSMRPGSPSGFGVVGDRPVFLLPGPPVAAMVGFDVLVRPALQLMLGQEEGRRNPTARGRLTRKVASALNRVDFVRVRVRDGEVDPVPGAGSSSLSSLSAAMGFVIVGKDLEGLEEGADVTVYLL